jgi:hypothetical protein
VLNNHDVVHELVCSIRSLRLVGSILELVQRHSTLELVLVLERSTLELGLELRNRNFELGLNKLKVHCTCYAGLEQN